MRKVAVEGGLEDVLEVVAELEPLGLLLGQSTLVTGPSLGDAVLLRSSASASVDGRVPRELLREGVGEGGHLAGGLRFVDGDAHPRDALGRVKLHDRRVLLAADLLAA